MQGLIQRVTQAKVEVDGEVVGEISKGILLLLGVEKHDTEQSAEKLLHKVSNYRIFTDQQGKMNLSLQDIQGELLVVSQFTLAADTKKGDAAKLFKCSDPSASQCVVRIFCRKSQSGRFTSCHRAVCC